VAGREKSSSLDPVTIKFARLFAELHDRKSGQLPWLRSHSSTTESTDRRLQFMFELFGGEIRYERYSEYVECRDGRKIPFSALSSGQQELLPMWSLMDYFGQLDERRSYRQNSLRLSGNELLYIEEPEAHLFPSAQSLLMEFMIGSVASPRTRRSILMTTHSPYIMSKLNVFLKAGSLGRRKRNSADVAKVVPRECWIDEDDVLAVAIQSGKLQNLIDGDGLVDAHYLDSISESISKQFSDLLDIEFGGKIDG
jgi:hypothetical protein